MSERPSPPHHRIVLLFDLDCFYAQCERIRLGLPEDICLALLQWNAVLAVTYPARKFGIQRGDSWEAVAEKSENTCWAIHLKILEKKPEGTTAIPAAAATPQSPRKEAPTKVANPYLKKPKDEEASSSSSVPSIIENMPPVTATSATLTQRLTAPTQDQFDAEKEIVADLEEAYDQIYKLSREEQLECQRRERGLRRFHSEGKSCLERYRIASMRIFSVVLDSLIQRLGGKDNFVLERASIDEFYLDITEYCYKLSNLQLSDMEHDTVVVGNESTDLVMDFSHDEIRSLALQRACQVSQWVRGDVFNTLGFTMSAGICTNKMMAKLAATYGKPNGQAVLYLDLFPNLLNTTKIRKVRHFGGKLGKQVLKVLQENSLDPRTFDGNAATMSDLQQLPLPLLQNHFAEETATFVFEACRGVDNESVRETSGALVKSITAFKSFPATSHVQEIQNWMSLMANEVCSRVAKDATRNFRYPKTCTLNYTYYTTGSGMRPVGMTSTRSFRNSKSVRLDFPHERNEDKSRDLVSQAMEKLLPILKVHALRGVGLSASNFESRGCPPKGVKGITTFFKKEESNKPTTSLPIRSVASEKFQKRKRKPINAQHYFSQREGVQDLDAEEGTHVLGEPEATTQYATKEDSHLHQKVEDLNGSQSYSLPAAPATVSNTTFDKDLELAKKLQASFDRENYVLTTSKRFRNVTSEHVPSNKSTGNKTQKIDSFFGRKS